MYFRGIIDDYIYGWGKWLCILSVSACVILVLIGAVGRFNFYDSYYRSSESQLIIANSQIIYGLIGIPVSIFLWLLVVGFAELINRVGLIVDLATKSVEDKH